MSDQRINLAELRTQAEKVSTGRVQTLEGHILGRTVLALVEAVEAAANLPWMEMSDELETALDRFDFGERP